MMALRIATLSPMLTAEYFHSCTFSFLLQNSRVTTRLSCVKMECAFRREFFVTWPMIAETDLMREAAI